MYQTNYTFLMLIIPGVHISSESDKEGLSLEICIVVFLFLSYE